MSTVSVIYDLIGRDNLSPSFNKAGDSASKLQKTLDGVGKAVAIAGAAMVTSAVAIGTESVKAAVSFQASMERIHTQAGASQGAVESLTKSVLALAPSTQQGPQQLADSLYHLKSVGLDNADAMKALQTASNLAAVGGSNLEETTNALAGAWRSGIKGATDFGTAAATVNAIVGAGNMTMQDFVSAIGTGVLPVARTFDVSLSSVGSALALLTDEGVSATDAGTRLKTSLALMGAPSVSASKYLGALGLSATDLAVAMRGPQGIIGAIGLLKTHVDNSGLSAVQAAYDLTRAFGGGQTGAAIMTLVNNYDVLQKKQQQINDSIGNYGPAVTAQRQTAQAQFALLRSSLDTLGTRLGLDLLPPVTAFVKYLAATAVPAVANFAHAVMSIIPVGTIKRDFDQVESWINNLFGINKKPVKVPVQLGPVVGGSKPSIFNAPVTVPAKLGPVVGGTSTLYNLPAATIQARLGPEIGGQTDQIFNKLPAQAQSATSSFGSSLIAQVKKINWGELFADVLTGAVTGAQKIGAAFLQLLGKIDWTSLGGVAATALVGLAVGLVNNLVPALISEAIHHPLDMVMFLVSLIPVGRAAGILIDIFDKIPILGTLLKFLLGPIESLGGAMESALGKVLKKVFGPVGDLIGGYFKDAGSWLTGKGESLLLGLWYGAEDAWATVFKWLGKIQDWIASPFLKAGSWLVSKGSDIISGLWRGQEDQWSVAWSWLTKIGGWIGSVFSKAASWLVGHGQDIISGLWRGQVAEWSDTWSWLTKIPGWIGSVFSKASSWLVGHGGDIISGLKTGMWDAMKDIGSWVKTNVVDPVVSWVKHWFGIHSPSTVMAGLGGHLMSGLFKGMMGADLTGMIQQIFGSLPSALGAIVEKGLVSMASLPSKALDAIGGLAGKGLSWLSGLLGKFTGGGGGNSANQALGKTMAAAMGWTGSQWTALQALWNRESGWSTTATNPSSGAYGIPQSLPASKMASSGADWLTNAATQIKWGLGYILGRYGSPAAAWGHETSFGWYGHGGRFAADQIIGVGERGPELAVFGQPGTILSPEQSAKLRASGGSDGPALHVGTVNVNHVPGFTTTSDIEQALTMAARQVRLARR